jgi:hypothetical protein
MHILELFLRIPDALNLAFAAIKYWRVTISLLIATGLAVVICVIWDAPAVRWIAGFHIFVIMALVGVLWETNRKHPRFRHRGA